MNKERTRACKVYKPQQSTTGKLTTIKLTPKKATPNPTTKKLTTNNSTTSSTNDLVYQSMNGKIINPSCLLVG
jgi:hypothetical protein